MAMGLKNAPAHFQKIMEKVLARGLNCYVCVYIDDIVVFGGDNIDEHLYLVREVFCLKQIKLLGKIVSGDSVAPDPALVETMVNYPVPQNRKQIVQFLALVGYYRSFINGFHNLSEPLRLLDRDTTPWFWGPDQVKAFKELKLLLL